MPSKPVVVIGGGLAGLATAAYLARAGRRVTVYERTSELGGRARTDSPAGFRINTGPHALYRAGAGAAVLRELGVTYTGGVPSVSGGYALRGGRAHGFPTGFFSLLTTGLLGVSDKVAAARIVASVPKVDVEALRGLTLREWVESVASSEPVRELVYAFARVSTYANAPDLASAAATVAQIQLAAKAGVLYLDGGWRTLVEGLRAAAVGAGATIRTGEKIESVEPFAGSEIVVAAGPSVASALLGRRFDDLIPVRAACLDVALSALPKPRARFALGIDAPTYFSVHSHYAELAPEGGALIHVAKYLGPGDTCEREELEAIVDALQPGWREAAIVNRFLPNLVVSHALVTPAGRPGVRQGDAYVVGDWVGDEGMLADAALASARQAAAAIESSATSIESIAA